MLLWHHSCGFRHWRLCISESARNPFCLKMLNFCVAFFSLVPKEFIPYAKNLPSVCIAFMWLRSHGTIRCLKILFVMVDSVGESLPFIGTSFCNISTGKQVWKSESRKWNYQYPKAKIVCFFFGYLIWFILFFTSCFCYCKWLFLT